MDLNRSVRKFANVPIDGWDGSAWTTGVGKGIVEVYSRFITERTFGAVKRILMTPDPISDLYTVFRLPDGARFLRAFMNPDYFSSATYNHVYLMQQASEDCKIVSFVETTSASGVGGTQAEVKTVDLPCYRERYSATSSSAGDAVVYTRTRFLLPKGTAVSVDDEIEIGTQRFHVNEVDTELDLTRAYVVN